MRFFYSLLFTAVAAAEAVSNLQNDVKITTPEDAGTLLKETYAKLAEMYSTERPNNEAELIRGSGKVLTMFCAENDSECHENTYKLTEKEATDAAEGPQEVIFSDKFDPELMKSIENMELTLQQLNLENMDTVLDKLASIRDEIENMDHVIAADKDAALIGVNIGLESVKLWHKVYSDPSHSLYGIHYPSHYLNADNKDGGEKGRKLKEVDMAEISLSDFQAGVNRVMKQMSKGQDLMVSELARSFLARDVLVRCYYGGWGYYWRRDGDEDGDE